MPSLSGHFCGVRFESNERHECLVGPQPFRRLRIPAKPRCRAHITCSRASLALVVRFGLWDDEGSTSVHAAHGDFTEPSEGAHAVADRRIPTPSIWGPWRARTIKVEDSSIVRLVGISLVNCCGGDKGESEGDEVAEPSRQTPFGV
jgi:hypothetical protein